jgi:hypothetical protein
MRAAAIWSARRQSVPAGAFDCACATSGDNSSGGISSATHSVATPAPRRKANSASNIKGGRSQ